MATPPVAVSSSPMVSVTITSVANQFGVLKRYDRGITISDLKSKLELVIGAYAQTMKLSAYKDGKLICQLDNDEALLGSYHIDDGMIIHAEDKNLKTDEYSDTSKVEKFEISDEEYQKRRDSIRAFKLRNRMGQFNEEEMAQKAEAQRQKEEAEAEKAKDINANERCEVRVAGQPARRGLVKYVGEIHLKPGLWVGVHYDEPDGKNDGSVGDRRYFQCPHKYGAFLRPSSVEVGDFPEKTLDFDEDEM